MKQSKKMYLVVAGAGILTLGLTGSALAFHGGGVAHCDGCHSMHNSASNAANDAGSDFLMKGSDPSSTCLNCHEGSGGYHIASSDGSNVNQGGDFYWMKTSYQYDTGHSTPWSTESRHGHNVVASDFGFTADANNTEAPGGTFPASTLGCDSCHDPHGQVDGGTEAGTEPISVSGSYGENATEGTIAGNFRLLGDSSYITTLQSYSFNADAPVAVSANDWGSSYGYETDYGDGMSAWCGNCHGDYLGGTGTEKHPSGTMLNSTYRDRYNSYVASGDYTGSVEDGYDSLVPIERGTEDKSSLNATSTTGAESGAQVMCGTCHRAHGSAFDYAGRWDFGTELLVESSTDLEMNGDLTGDEADYYAFGSKVEIADRYNEEQRSLCNKCHVQD
ncbi:MAG: hypothetical protein ACLFV2_06615 [Desulfurivibrionaceae bacterium]